jgi:translation elongation factor EF-Ts
MIFELRNLLEDHKLISKMVEGKIQHWVQEHPSACFKQISVCSTSSSIENYLGLTHQERGESKCWHEQLRKKPLEQLVHSY